MANTAVRGTPGCTPPLLSPLPFHLPPRGPQILSLSSPFLLSLLSQRLVHPQPFSPLSLVGVRMVVDRVTPPRPPPHTLSRTIRPNIRLLSCKHVAIRGASALVRGGCRLCQRQFACGMCDGSVGLLQVFKAPVYTVAAEQKDKCRSERRGEGLSFSHVAPNHTLLQIRLFPPHNGLML